jgi:hypothetical protein
MILSLPPQVPKVEIACIPENPLNFVDDGCCKDEKMLCVISMMNAFCYGNLLYWFALTEIQCPSSATKAPVIHQTP